MASSGNTGENLGPTDVRLRLSALWAVLHHAWTWPRHDAGLPDPGS